MNENDKHVSGRIILKKEKITNGLYNVAPVLYMFIKLSMYRAVYRMRLIAIT